MLAFNLLAFFTYLKLMKAVGDFKLPDLNIPFVLEDGLENDVETFLGTDRLVTHSNPQTLPFSDSLSNLDSLKMKEIPYAQENPVQPLTSTTDKLSVSASIFRHNAPDHSIPDTGAFERKNHPMNYVYFTESARLHKSPKKIQRFLNPELTSKKSKQSINNEAIINLNNEASTIEANILGQGINLPKKGSNIFTSLSKPDFLSISMNNLLKSLQKIPADLIARSLEHPSQKFSRLLHFFFFQSPAAENRAGRIPSGKWFSAQLSAYINRICRSRFGRDNNCLRFFI
ncbi:hypothetical protein BY996DRAFT_799765 [Phakopsora pachyrhizi]|nr:hypothetical protein BY996DRAFT_799765 [Phakopsora pachyrhizi]